MRQKNKTEVGGFSISLPISLLDELDKRVAKLNYASRSEFTRDLIRSKIIDDSWNNDEAEAVGVLSIMYTMNQRDLLEKIYDLQNNCKARILSSSKSPLGNGYFLENMSLMGATKDIKSLEMSFGCLKGVVFCELLKAVVPQ
jgi:CopG family nickel-responsive transcriptional regulator